MHGGIYVSALHKNVSSKNIIRCTVASLRCQEILVDSLPVHDLLQYPIIICLYGVVYGQKKTSGKYREVKSEVTLHAKIFPP